MAKKVISDKRKSNPFISIIKGLSKKPRESLKNDGAEMQHSNGMNTQRNTQDSNNLNL